LRSRSSSSRLHRLYSEGIGFDASQPPLAWAKKSLHAGISATSLETYLHSEGIGQLYLRLLTDNFEEATRARKEGRPAVFRD
jgi:enoyl-CoA hydratase